MPVAEVPADLEGDGPALLLLANDHRTSEEDIPETLFITGNIDPVVIELGAANTEDAPPPTQQLLANWYRGQPDLPYTEDTDLRDGAGDVFATFWVPDNEALPEDAELDYVAHVTDSDFSMEAAPQLELFLQYALRLELLIPAEWDAHVGPSPWAVRFAYDDEIPAPGPIFDQNTYILFGTPHGNQRRRLPIRMPIAWWLTCSGMVGLGAWHEHDKLNLVVWPVGVDPDTHAMQTSIELAPLLDEGLDAAHDVCERWATLGFHDHDVCIELLAEDETPGDDVSNPPPPDDANEDDLPQEEQTQDSTDQGASSGCTSTPGPPPGGLLPLISLAIFMAFIRPKMTPPGGR